ncbi:MAG: hypothetical protein F6K26_33345 [Moorea sp. SIO2I5]|nr:hypothetical protein [Moorena sp. SIO2I5]
MYSVYYNRIWYQISNGCVLPFIKRMQVTQTIPSVPCSLLPAPCSLFPAPCSLLPNLN